MICNFVATKKQSQCQEHKDFYDIRPKGHNAQLSLVNGKGFLWETFLSLMQTFLEDQKDMPSSRLIDYVDQYKYK